MYRLSLVVLVLLAACAGCGSSAVRKAAPSVLPNVDFPYDSTWLAAMGAVQMHFPSLDLCNKDDRMITTHFKQDVNVDITSPFEYAWRAELIIVPRKSAEPRTTYDLRVSVGRYWRQTDPYKDSEEGWRLIGFDKDVESNIIESFKDQTLMDQRLRQRIGEFEKYRGSRP